MPDHRVLLSLVPEDLAVFAARVRGGKPVEHLGRGKLAEVFRWTHQGVALAAKRLPPLREEARRRALGASFALYPRRLRERGVRPLPARLLWLETDEGHEPWVVQRALAPKHLAPKALRHAASGPAVAVLESVLSHIVSVCDGALGIDAQLDNWGLVDGDLLFLDTAHPLVREPDGRDALGEEPYLHALPAPLRPLLQPRVAERIERFFHPRAACLDLLARLPEQRLERLSEPFRELANALPHPPIRQVEVLAEAADIERTRARLVAARRLAASWRRLWGLTPLETAR